VEVEDQVRLEVALVQTEAVMVVLLLVLRQLLAQQILVGAEALLMEVGAEVTVALES
jgi:hypothetical protein